MANFSKRTRKCPNCGNWSEWDGNPTDTCEHCGALLDEQGLIRQQRDEEKKEAEDKKFNITLIEIYPDDNPFVKFLKYVVRGVQIGFMAILSFILWVIAVAAG